MVKRNQSSLWVGKRKQKALIPGKVWGVVDLSSLCPPSLCRLCGSITASYYVLFCSGPTKSKEIILPTAFRRLCHFKLKPSGFWPFTEMLSFVWWNQAAGNSMKVRENMWLSATIKVSSDDEESMCSSVVQMHRTCYFFWALNRALGDQHSLFLKNKYRFSRCIILLIPVNIL